MIDRYASEISASAAIVAKSKEYAEFSTGRRLPNIVDGLTPIHRRIIWVASTGTRMMKVTEMGGNVGHLHPHGDTSINDAIITMCQPFSNIIPMVFSDCGIGSYSDTDAAAARYVDVHSSEFARDIFFNRVDLSTIRRQPNESGDGEEPSYLIPSIPYGLMCGLWALMPGFRINVPSLGIKALCQLTTRYIELRQTPGWQSKLSTLVGYLVPDFPSYGTLMNRDDLVNHYRAGDYSYPLCVEGTMQITPKTIYIRSVAPDENLLQQFEKLCELMKQKGSPINSHVAEIRDGAGRRHGQLVGNLVIELRRGENPFQLLDLIKKSCKYTVQKWKPSMLYTDTLGRIVPANPFDVLDAWYHARFGSVLGELKQDQVKYVQRHRQLDALIVVSDNPDEVVRIIKKSIDKPAAIVHLCKRFDFSEYQSTYLVELPLHQLTEKGRDELVAEKKEVTKKIEEHQKKFLEIPSRIIRDVEYIENKYAPKYPRKCNIPSYKGYVEYDQGGFVQIETLDEFDKLINDFGTERLKLHLYTANEYTYSVLDGVIKDDFPIIHSKEVYASAMYRLAHRPKYLLVHHADGGAYLFDSVASRASVPEHCKLIPVASTCVRIGKDGTAERIALKSDHVKRGYITRGFPLEGVHFSPLESEEFAVIHCNSAEPNVIKIDWIKQRGHLNKIVVGNWFVLGVYDPTRVIAVTIPSEARSRTPIHHLYLPDLSKQMKCGESLKIHIGKRTLSNGKSLVQYARRSELWVPGN